jgi:fructokinase
MKALVFGEILWDIIKGKPYLGGAAFNLAAHLAKMGGDVSVLSAVGDDELGRLALKHAREYGIDSTCIETDPDRPTGTVDVIVDESGQPDYTIHEGVAFDAITLDEKRLARIAATTWDVVYIGTLAQRSTENRDTLTRVLSAVRRNQVFYDVNLRQTYFTLERIERSLLASTIVKINDDESDALSRMLYGDVMPIEAVARRLLDSYGLEVVIVTRGGEGAYLHSADRSCYTTAADVEIVDTVGAGDSFSAAFLFSYLSGQPLAVAGNLASELADYVVTQSGAIPEYPESLSARFR